MGGYCSDIFTTRSLLVSPRPPMGRVYERISPPQDFGLSHEICCDQWNVSGWDVTNDFRSTFRNWRCPLASATATAGIYWYSPVCYTAMVGLINHVTFWIDSNALTVSLSQTNSSVAKAKTFNGSQMPMHYVQVADFQRCCCGPDRQCESTSDKSSLVTTSSCRSTSYLLNPLYSFTRVFPFWSVMWTKVPLFKNLSYITWMIKAEI